MNRWIRELIIIVLVLVAIGVFSEIVFDENVPLYANVILAMLMSDQLK